MALAVRIIVDSCARSLKWIARSSPWQRSKRWQTRGRFLPPPWRTPCASTTSIPKDPIQLGAELAESRRTGMAVATRSISVTVPDIGDFKDVPVVEVQVKPGDVVKVDDPLVTLESDKATMEVPA